MSMKRTLSEADLTLPPDAGEDEQQANLLAEEQMTAPVVEQASTPAVEQASSPAVEQASTPAVEQASTPAVQGTAPAKQDQQGRLHQQNASLSDTTIEDIPVEIVEKILVESVVLEVIGLKLVKRSWKGKADVVAARLKDVCQDWSKVLSADGVQREILKRLDEIPAPIPRLDVVHQGMIGTSVFRLATLGTNLLILPETSDRNYILLVFDRTDSAQRRLTIQLPNSPRDMAACRLSNCAYVLADDKDNDQEFTSVYRISTDEFEDNVNLFLNELNEESSAISISKDGHLYILHVSEIDGIGRIDIYDAEGQYVRQMVFPAKDFGLTFGDSVIHRMNQNLIMTSFESYRFIVTEADQDGHVVRRFEPRLNACLGMVFADRAERVLFTTKQSNSFRLYDREFAELGIINAPVNLGKLNLLHYSEEHDDLIAVSSGNAKNQSAIAVLKLADD